MNEYRIDKAPRDTKSCPCGMNNLLWLGSNKKLALATYARLWRVIDTNIILSEWNPSMNNYVIIRGTTLSESGKTKS